MGTLNASKTSMPAPSSERLRTVQSMIDFVIIEKDLPTLQDPSPGAFRLGLSAPPYDAAVPPQRLGFVKRGISALHQFVEVADSRGERRNPKAGGHSDGLTVEVKG